MGVLMTRSWRDALVLSEVVSERLMVVRFALKHGFLSVVCCHAPCLSAEDDERREFFEKLDVVLARVEVNDKLIVMGDFNLRLGRGVDGDKCVGNQLPDCVPCENGWQLRSVAMNHELRVMNSVERQPRER